MALATRPKPKVQHKKRVAKHHRRSKHYLKAYHPYLPVLGVLALGYLANRIWPGSLAGGSFSVSPEAATRIEALSGDTSGTALLAVIVVAALAFGIYVGMHWYRFQRVLSRGEEFAVKHPWFDVILAILFTAGVVLTRRAAI